MSNIEYRVSALEQAISNVVRVFVIAELDEIKKKIRLEADELKTAWVDWPADNGRNFRKWKPLRVGQQMIVVSIGGDLSQALVVGEIYSDQLSAPAEDPEIDVVKYSNGDIFERNAVTGKIKITAAGGFELRGDVEITGKVVSTGDQLAGGVSTINHVHGKVSAGKSRTGKPS